MIQTFLFLIRRFRLLALLALVAIAAFACTQEAVTAANEQTTRVVAEAREHLEQVEAFLAKAEVAADVAAEVATEVTALREAYEAEEYSTALAHARAALQTVADAGVDVPPDVGKHLAQAELLLSLIGK